MLCFHTHLLAPVWTVCSLDNTMEADSQIYTCMCVRICVCVYIHFLIFFFQKLLSILGKFIKLGTSWTLQLIALNLSSDPMVYFARGKLLSLWRRKTNFLNITVKNCKATDVPNFTTIQPAVRWEMAKKQGVSRFSVVVLCFSSSMLQCLYLLYKDAWYQWSCHNAYTPDITFLHMYLFPAQFLCNLLLYSCNLQYKKKVMLSFHQSCCK